MWRAATDATKKKFNDMSEKRKKVSRVLRIDTKSFYSRFHSIKMLMAAFVPMQELAAEKPAAAAKKVSS